MKPMVFQEGELIVGPLSKPRTPISSRALGALGLGSGLIGLVSVALGMGSWMILGAAFVVWCFSGWGLFFADSGNNRDVRVLGYIFLSAGLLVAAAMALKLYLVALGPAWQL